MTLEEIIRTAAEKGWLSHTSIVRTPAGLWQVNTPSRFAPNAWACETDADPVVALTNALLPYGRPELSLEEMLE